MRESTPVAREHRALWSAVERRLAALDWDSPVTLEQAQALLDGMPQRDSDENLESWLHRSFGLALGSAARQDASLAPADKVVPFLRPPGGRLRVIGQALAWAAAERDERSPTLPERMEIGRGAFRVQFAADGGNIRVTLEALGFELARLAGQEVAVTGPGGIGQLLALVDLDMRGEGEFEVADTPEARALLLQMQIGELEPE
jgi:hypothetical protein